MTATALPPREIDFNLPPAIDIASFRRVTAGLTRCALEAAATRPDDLAGRTERRGRVIRAVHANMELWAVVLHEVLDTANGLSSTLRARLVELAEVSIRHGARVLQEDAAVDPLLTVNRSLIERLQWSDGQQAAPAEPARPALAVVGDR
jgi:flagellar biosynthesis regulator FlaF